MRITVLGATGMAGTAVVNEALSRGHEVTAVSRRRRHRAGARLTSRLIGWRIDIIRAAVAPITMGDKVKAASGTLQQALGLPEAIAMRLVEKGLHSIELLDTVDEEMLVGEGFSVEEAQDILNRVRLANPGAAPQA